jgi:hypothetical protein
MPEREKPGNDYIAHVVVQAGGASNIVPDVRITLKELGDSNSRSYLSMNLYEARSALKELTGAIDKAEKMVKALA